MRSSYLRTVSHLHRDEQGLTVMETIAVIAAFAAVALLALFALLNGGVFMAEAGRETVCSGVQQAKTDLETVGPVTLKCTDTGEVRYIIFTVRNTLEESPVDMTPWDDEGAAVNKMVINLNTAIDSLHNVKWRAEKIGSADNDNLLESGEQFEVTIDLADLGRGKLLTAPLKNNSQISIQLKPDSGYVVTIQRTLPACLGDVTVLH